MIDFSKPTVIDKKFYKINDRLTEIRNNAEEAKSMSAVSNVRKGIAKLQDEDRKDIVANCKNALAFICDEILFYVEKEPDAISFFEEQITDLVKDICCKKALDSCHDWEYQFDEEKHQKNKKENQAKYKIDSLEKDKYKLKEQKVQIEAQDRDQKDKEQQIKTIDKQIAAVDNQIAQLRQSIDTKTSCEVTNSILQTSAQANALNDDFDVAKQTEVVLSARENITKNNQMNAFANSGLDMLLDMSADVQIASPSDNKADTFAMQVAAEALKVAKSVDVSQDIVAMRNEMKQYHEQSMAHVSQVADKQTVQLESHMDERFDSIDKMLAQIIKEEEDCLNMPTHDIVSRVNSFLSNDNSTGLNHAFYALRLCIEKYCRYKYGREMNDELDFGARFGDTFKKKPQVEEKMRHMGVEQSILGVIAPVYRAANKFVHDNAEEISAKSEEEHRKTAVRYAQRLHDNNIDQEWNVVAGTLNLYNATETASKRWIEDAIQKSDNIQEIFDEFENKYVYKKQETRENFLRRQGVKELPEIIYSHKDRLKNYLEESTGRSQSIIIKERKSNNNNNSYNKREWQKQR